MMTDDGVRRSRRRDAWTAVALGAAAAVVVGLLVLPASGIDREPPECYAVVGYVVPCGAGLALGLALAGAALVGAVTYLVRPRRRP
jgi:peptidoglycan/LPS O-acetylase OafA/YrhL